MERESAVFVKSPSFASPDRPTVVVFEKQPRWAPELERQFLAEEVRVIACRSVKDAAERTAGVARGAVLLDAAVAPSDCLQYLRHALSDPRTLPVLIVGAPPIAPLEWSFRELGARAFFVKKIPGHEMASLCRRQWGGRIPATSERKPSGKEPVSSKHHQGPSER